MKVGGRYPMDEGHIVVDAIEAIAIDEITQDLARESGFDSVEALLRIAVRPDTCGWASHP